MLLFLNHSGNSDSRLQLTIEIRVRKKKEEVRIFHVYIFTEKKIK